MFFLGQDAYELTQAQRRPQQRLHGIPARARLNQRFQIAEQRGVLDDFALAPAARLANASRRC